MNIECRFSWKSEPVGYTPVCSSNFLNRHGVSLLDCVLMDNGGLCTSETIPWLNEGIERVKAVASGKVESSHWSRETWGVKFQGETARIYSLHDETYLQTLSLSGFRKALEEWIDFLQTSEGDRQPEKISFAVETV
ncbi:hypothetical protein [Blastopirellula marina]|uniref:Uncharacterized protein n=1 Tax=Blastopirellula marina TaxID=124 RepID=A0A2S8G938_9BACT|nr:hypothetical protein [Blastopirellula marina]PQO40939.1 hypothetical protein C5Y98_04995 [Blastopirellula marina]PTL45821.1 hypothetical protein C5Y97_04995 [Blastopirellula marina]